jgi:GxxExxY protein
MGKQYSAHQYPLQELTEKIISAAMAVHTSLGPGFLEQIYENALELELTNRGHQVQRQVWLDVLYRGHVVGQHRLDMLVDQEVVIELKSVEALAAVHKAQLRSTLKAAEKRIGLLMNFNQRKLRDGIRRVIN